MSSVGLLFVGAVLLLNGLLFLGRVEPKGVAVFNLFVGALQTAIPFYLVATAATPDAVLGAAGIFLFGFTYLYVGINTLGGLPSDGLGWYALWVAVIAVGFGVTNVVRFEDAATGLLWFQWAVLWGLFWAVLALGKEALTPIAGWLAVVQSITTCTIPGFLGLLGVWGDVPAWGVAISAAASLVVLAPLLRRPGSAPLAAPAGA